MLCLVNVFDKGQVKDKCLFKYFVDKNCDLEQMNLAQAALT